MIVFDHFFAKYVFNGYEKGRHFLGHDGHCLGSWEGLEWFPKFEGGSFLGLRGDSIVPGSL